MSLQWTLIAGFLYTEIFIVLLLLLPVASPTRWQKLFKSRFLQSLSYQASVYFIILLAVLILFLIDAIREIRKYSSTEHVGEHGFSLEMQENMRLFRAQRNFYISGFALFLSLVIRRLVTLISTEATLLAQNEALMRQAQSATTTARTLLSQKSGESAQNDTNEAHDKALTELKHQIGELQLKNEELTNQIGELQSKNEELTNKLLKEQKDKEAVVSQADSLAKEYDRLTTEHAKLSQSSGDKKCD